MYASVTGLKLHSPLHLFRFYWHAARCRRQALAAPGNLLTQVSGVAGVQHTFTVWESETDARAFVHSGAHTKATEVFHAIGSGRIYGYHCEAMPTWAQAYSLWQAHAWEYR